MSFWTSSFVGLALVAALLGCHRDVKPTITAVSIVNVPAGGGMAQFAVQRDGHMRGGHLSGNNPPFVHQDEGQLDSVTLASLWPLVDRLTDSLPTANPPSGRGYVMLQLDFSAGEPWLYAWPEKARAPNERVRAVTDWLLVHKIGGW